MSGHLDGSWAEQVAAVEPGLHPATMGDKPSRREAAYDDLESVPPHRVGEIVGGDLYVSPQPETLHA